VKAIVSVWVALIMVFALVSIGEAGTGSSYNGNLAALVETHNGHADAGTKDADNPGYFPAGSPYPCIASPAYTDYAEARAVPCPVNERARRVPDPMGSPGY
jgi:hypothetical protein